MIDPEVLEMLCCPETHQDLTAATKEEVERINQVILGSGVVNRNGERVQEPVGDALIRRDRRVVYLVRHGIPIMIADEAVVFEDVLGDSRYLPKE